MECGHKEYDISVMGSLEKKRWGQLTGLCLWESDRKVHKWRSHDTAPCNRLIMSQALKCLDCNHVTVGMARILRTSFKFIFQCQHNLEQLLNEWLTTIISVVYKFLWDWVQLCWKGKHPDT